VTRDVRGVRLRITWPSGQPVRYKTDVEFVSILLPLGAKVNMELASATLLQTFVNFGTLYQWSSHFNCVAVLPLLKRR
jgi:hypothetical protein